ncbi:MAG TPA: hypothetical protein VK506_03425, partial [Conexibacter sp.]|nr:hypothetical protein [Conexibacter sp.]
IALAGPVLLSALVLTLRDRPLPLRAATVPVLVQVSQVLLATFVVAAVIAQYGHTYDATYSEGKPFRRVYFTPATLVVSALLTAAGAALLRRDALVARIGALARETRALRIGALLAALLFVALWLLTAFNTELSYGNAHGGVTGNVSFWLDEAYAVLDGRGPLVDFQAQYSHLWPYLAAGPMALLGPSLESYEAVMLTASALTMLAVFLIFRRLVGRSLLALAIFLPFVATSFFMELGPPDNRYGPANLFSMFPMRYGGPFLLAFLLVCHLEGASPRRRWPLFLVAGLVLLNNVEFGIPAFAATAAALLWADDRPARPRVLALLREGALGLLGAAALVALLTLLVVGSLPHFGMLFTFSRMWGVAGVTMLPMRPFGLHLALYATFAATIVVATVRAQSGAEGRALTAMLAWSGVFGLGAGSYFAGRSHPEVLISLFSIWAFALALLLIVVVPAIRARPGHRPTVAEVAVLAGCAIAVCSLAQMPTPWSQFERIGDEAAVADLQAADARAFVAASGAAPGEHLVIMLPMGHRVGYDLGLVNVAPYVSLISMPAVRQLQETIDALRESGGNRLILARYQTLPEMQELIVRNGFELVRAEDEHAEYRATR